MSAGNRTAFDGQTAFTGIGPYLAAKNAFEVLAALAEPFTHLPRQTWGYSLSEIDQAAQALPALTKGLAGPQIPSALVRWYQTVGRVPELTASQNRLHAPKELELRDDVIVIYTENQGCASWGIRAQDLTLADPPVFYNDGDGWKPEADTITCFALTVGLSELCLSRSKSACAGTADDRAIGLLRARLRRVSVQPLRWPAPEREASFLANDAVLVLLEAEFLFAVARTGELESYLNDLTAPGSIEWI